MHLLKLLLTYQYFRLIGDLRTLDFNSDGLGSDLTCIFHSVQCFDVLPPPPSPFLHHNEYRTDRLESPYSSSLIRDKRRCGHLPHRGWNRVTVPATRSSIESVSMVPSAVRTGEAQTGLGPELVYSSPLFPLPVALVASPLFSGVRGWSAGRLGGRGRMIY